MPEVPFVHLHVHSDYSLLDGACRLDKLIERAQELGMPGVAVTDHGNMYGICRFLNTAEQINAPTLKAIKKAEKKLEECESESERAELEREIAAEKEKIFHAIAGCEAYMAEGSRFEKDQKPYHLVLLAKNPTGYKTLCHLVSKGFEDGFYRRPRIDAELLASHHEGLVISSACLAGEIPRAIRENDFDAARDAIVRFKSYKGADFYLELMLHPKKESYDTGRTMREQIQVNGGLIRLALETNTPLIITNDAHFLREEDSEQHDFLLCVSTNKRMEDPDRIRYTHQEHIKSGSELRRMFLQKEHYEAIAAAYQETLLRSPNPDLPKVIELEEYTQIIDNALAQTVRIARSVEPYSLRRPPQMPEFEVPEGFEDEKSYLRHLVAEGAKKRWGDSITQEHRDRLEFELSTIEKMGFSGYFLIVWDFIRAAREMDVLVGPGRGSAAGSAISYCLRITDIDPLKYGLLFERFLNPDRVSLPDIDIDFEDSKRDLVLDYVRKRYGEECVAGISTFQKMMMKDAINESAKRYSQSRDVVKPVTDLIAEGRGADTFDKLKEKNPAAYKKLEELTGQSGTLFNRAKRVEGHVRSAGRHACGYIIGKEPLMNLVPMVKPSGSSKKKTESVDGDQLFVQYEGSDLENLGLIKMDFLGLTTLSVLRVACELIQKHHGVTIDLDNIPLDDTATLELFAAGETIGLFQFESPGMRKYLKQLKPDKFEDLIAMNALYRPGPMDNIPTFIRRKRGQEAITYLSEESEQVLAETYGVTVYQEQVMRLARIIAGFTPGESDRLRKVIAKKKKGELPEMEGLFLQGCKNNNFPLEKAKEVWAEWIKFAEYAFNKSHSTCYAYVAFQTGYLKAHYPGEFMAANLEVAHSDASRIQVLIAECQRMGLEVLQPDVNKSYTSFSMEGENAIRYGLNAIKMVGSESMLHLVEEREKNSPYENAQDLVARIGSKDSNKKNLEGLIKSGALDTLAPDNDRVYYFQPYEELGRPGIQAKSPQAKDGEESYWYEVLMEYAKQVEEFKIQSAGGSLIQCALTPPPYPELTREISRVELLSAERQYVGAYISEHPLTPFRQELQYLCTAPLSNIALLLDQREFGEYIVGGLVRSVKKMERTSRNGKTYSELLVTLDDFSGDHTFRFFGDKVTRYETLFEADTVVCMRINIVASPNNLPPNVNVEAVEPYHQAVGSMYRTLEVEIDARNFTQERLDTLRQLVSKERGKTTLSFDLYDSQNNRSIRCQSHAEPVKINAQRIENLIEEGFSLKVNGRRIEQNDDSFVEESVAEEMEFEEF